MSSDTTSPAPAQTGPLPPDAPTSDERGGLRHSVGATASRLQDEALGLRSARAQIRARAQLAVLRRSAGLQPVDDPVAWQAVLELMTPPLLDREIGRGDVPSRSEKAAFNAITLFALHLQSRTRSMHVPGRSFGSAIRLLNRARQSGSIRPRFDAVLAARQERSRLIHARSLITLLRSDDIGFDYGLFAQDLRSLMTPERRAGVLLRWGRDVAIAPRGEHDTKEAIPSPSDINLQ